MAYKYSRQKSEPLTDDEMKQKYEDIQEEMKEVLKWKKESEANFENPKSSPQKKGAAKRALKKIERRMNTIQGQIIYWKFRLSGESHFKASIEMNEYWASCKEY